MLGIHSQINTMHLSMQMHSHARTRKNSFAHTRTNTHAHTHTYKSRGGVNSSLWSLTKFTEFGKLVKRAPGRE